MKHTNYCVLFILGISDVVIIGKIDGISVYSANLFGGTNSSQALIMQNLAVTSILCTKFFYCLSRNRDTTRLRYANTMLFVNNVKKDDEGKGYS